MAGYTDEIKSFVDQIFKNLDEDEHRLFCSTSGNTPGMPKDLKSFLSRDPKNKACYFSTATVVEDPDFEHGSKLHFARLRNQKKFFKRLYCVVLDDIGTGPGSKCAPSKLPDLLRYEYSWCIETSPDNFQYGFLLEEPIEDVNAASDFISLIYSAGPWDSGGALAGKLVRLPYGINIKDKYASKEGPFRVHNTEELEDQMNTFTPDELLDAVNAGVTWADVVAGSAGKKDPRRTSGTAPWRDGAYLANLEGVSDEVVDFLNEKELIINEGPEWLEIICPWHMEHSDGGSTAGYSPIGFGTRPDTRAFHCFHGHCAERSITDFLLDVQAKGGPEVGYKDVAPLETVKWVFVANSGTGFYFNVTTDTPLRYAPASWRQMYCKKVYYVKANSKEGTTKSMPLWKMMEDNILTLQGVVYEPKSPLIVEHADGSRFLNIFKRPSWELEDVLDYDKNVAKFVNFIQYLIPDREDSEWFLDHLASKVQDHEMRGPCAVLTTPVQGSGRGTLSGMLSKLWGQANTVTVGLNELLKGLSGEGFNDWMQNIYVVVPEAKDFNLNPRQEHKAYEALKAGVDPSATTHVLKTKFGSQCAEQVYSTYIICSNHENTLNIPLNDRRFKFIRCVTKVADDEYFAELYKWLDTKWEPSIWCMLRTRNLDNYNPFTSVASITADADEILERLLMKRSEATQVQKLVIASILFAEKHCDGILCTKLVKDWIATYPAVCGVPNNTYWDSQFMKSLRDVTEALGPKNAPKKFKRNNKMYYLRHTIERAGEGIKTSGAVYKDESLVAGISEKIYNTTAEDFRDFIIELDNASE